MYYICDVRKPSEPFMFFDEYERGGLVPAVYEDKAEAEKICDKMNQYTKLTQFDVKEMAE